MDTASDNPLRRFTSFWLGLAIFLAFAILCVFLAPLLKGKKDDAAYREAAAERLETKKTVEQAQADALKVAPESVFGEVGKGLLGAKPEAIRDNSQLVLGSPTALALENGSSETITIDQGDPNAPIDPAVMEAGKAAYATCMACHGPTGGGVPNLAPPLANSEWVQGRIENLIRIQLRGLTGPISVNGVDYNLAAPMIPQAFQSDEQIAAVLTYVRNSFGNKGTAVTPDMVKAFRGEVGKPMLTVEDLIPPKAE